MMVMKRRKCIKEISSLEILKGENFADYAAS